MSQWLPTAAVMQLTWRWVPQAARFRGGVREFGAPLEETSMCSTR